MQHVVIIFGLLVVKADFVPIVLIGLSMMTGSPLLSDLIAFGAGHLYYFLSDVFPRQPLGFRILKTPRILKVIFNEQDEISRNYSGVERGAGDGDNNNNLVNERVQEAAAPLIDDIGNGFPI